MRVAIIGAGGTGGLYGAALHRAGHQVQFLARGQHLRAIQENGLRVESPQFGTFSIQVDATDESSSLSEADFVLFAVKTYDVQEAAAAARHAVGPSALVLTLQNGVEAPDQVAAVVGKEHVLIGTTALETTIGAPGVIRHLNAKHLVTASELDGPPTERVERLVAELKAAEINASVAADGRRALWAKAAFLIPLAGATAVTDAKLGAILARPETRVLFDDLADDVWRVARASGHEVPKGTPDLFGPDSQASMARDFARGGPTELEALTGAIVRLGERLDVAVPTSRAVYAILKVREQGFRRSSG